MHEPLSNILCDSPSYLSHALGMSFYTVFMAKLPQPGSQGEPGHSLKRKKIKDKTIRAEMEAGATPVNVQFSFKNSKQGFYNA